MTINDRFRELRKACDMNQTEWSQLLGITRGGVTMIESGNRSVTEKHIQMLKVNYKGEKAINFDWIRTGEGEMFKPTAKIDAIAQLTHELFTDKDDNFKTRLILALSRLTPKQWAALEEVVDTVYEQVYGKEEDQ